MPEWQLLCVSYGIYCVPSVYLLRCSKPQRHKTRMCYMASAARVRWHLCCVTKATCKQHTWRWMRQHTITPITSSRHVNMKHTQRQ